MVLSCVNKRNAHAGGAAALVAVVAVGVVFGPAERPQSRVETHEVQLTATILGAVQNTSLLDEAAPADSALIAAAADVAAPLAETTPVLPAAATEDSFFDTPLGTALIAANFLILPLWFLATPVTLPLSMLVAASQVTVDGPLGSFQFLLYTGVGFLLGPLGLLAPIISGSASAAAAAKPASARAAGHEAVSSPSVAATAEPVAVVQGATPVVGEYTVTAAQTRGRHVERQPSRARAAAANSGNPTVRAYGDQKVAVGVENPSAVPADDAEISRPDISEAPKSKSAAKSHSRR